MSEPRSRFARYGVAIGLTAAVLPIRLAFTSGMGAQVAFLLALPAVSLSGFYGGLGPGLTATALALLQTLVVTALQGMNPFESVTITRAGVFVLAGVLVSWLCESLLRARHRAELLLSERLATESALHERDERLQVIADAAPGLVGYVGADCRYLLCNDAYRVWFGLDPGAIKGLHVRDVLGPEAFAKVEPKLRRALAGETVVWEEELPYREPGRRWVHVTYSPDRDRRGRVRGVAVLVQDIGDRKRAEAALRQVAERAEALRARAEASERAKDEFLAVLSHELRTPLSPVLTAAQMLETDESTTAKVRTLGALIRRNTELEARLIDDLLDLTRVSRGKLSLNLEPVDVHATISEVLRSCATDLEEKRLVVELDLAASQRVVSADQARLQQVLWNVLKNAAKFSSQGGTITVATRNPAPGHLAFMVMDEGAGIEADVLPRIFNAFEQGGSEVTKRFGGLGLGLAVSRALVEAQGGTIEASSAGRDRGAIFTVTLPLSRRPSSPGDSVQAAEAPPARRLSVLLVEDHEDTATMLSELLRNRGYDVKTADTLAAALRIAGTQSFDLLVSDIGLPDGNGHDLMRQLSARGPVRGVALSGYGMERDIAESRAAGFLEHLTKPVSPQRLIESLTRILNSP